MYKQSPRCFVEVKDVADPPIRDGLLLAVTLFENSDASATTVSLFCRAPSMSVPASGQIDRPGRVGKSAKCLADRYS